MTPARDRTAARCQECGDGKLGRRELGRRELLLAAGSVGLVTALSGCARPSPAPAPDTRPIAMVYRGKASCAGCSESVARLLESNPTPFRAVYCGPDEDVQITAASLAGAVIYAQPGGGTVTPAWHQMRRHADDIRAWVRGGGRYLGFCLGGYLAGATPGFGLLPGDAAEYVGSAGATVATTRDTVIPVRWGGAVRQMYFQDGPLFTLNPGGSATVLATYDTGAPAAVVADYGAGRVGVVGPHPEADQSWYRGSGLSNPEGIVFDLGHDLIAHTMQSPAARR